MTETWPEQQKTRHDIWKTYSKSNPRPDSWHLRHWLHFWQLRTTILTFTLWPLNKEWWWQHSQFLRCFLWGFPYCPNDSMKKGCIEKTGTHPLCFHSPPFFSSSSLDSTGFSQTAVQSNPCPAPTDSLDNTWAESERAESFANSAPLTLQETYQRRLLVRRFKMRYEGSL